MHVCNHVLLILFTLNCRKLNFMSEMKQDTSHCVRDKHLCQCVCVGCCLFQLPLLSLFFIIYSVKVHIQYFTKLLNYRLSYLCVLTVPLIGDQMELFPDNDSSNSLEHVLFPAATLISREADQSRRQHSHVIIILAE